MFAPLSGIAANISGEEWPSPDDLNLLATNCSARLKFSALTDNAAPGAADYERRIHDDGVVPLRPANWHDLFNALVWLAFPRTKAAINRAHVEALRAIPGSVPGPRSVRRDALTLFDESGVLVLSSDPVVLTRIRAFDWKRLFWDERAALQRTTRFLLFGHALYEKALSPYIGITGHALLLALPGAADESDQDTLLARADVLAAEAVQTNLAKPRDLSPLPLLGVPGWWHANNEAVFYGDTNYFRPGRMSRARGGMHAQDARAAAREDFTG